MTRDELTLMAMRLGGVQLEFREARYDLGERNPEQAARMYLGEQLAESIGADLQRLNDVREGLRRDGVIK